LSHRHIGTEQMLLGLLREKKAHAAVVLRQHGADIAEIRLKLAGSASPYREPRKLANGTYVCRTSSTPAGDAMATLSSFLSGLKVETSPELADFFAQNGQVIDISGKMWFGREEIRTAFERLRAPYAKKNTTYRVERTFSERPEAVLASVLWESAVHTDQTSRSVLRMTILLFLRAKSGASFSCKSCQSLQNVGQCQSNSRAGAAVPGRFSHLPPGLLLRINSYVIHEHLLGKLRGCIGIARPVSADRHIQKNENRVIEHPLAARGPLRPSECRIIIRIDVEANCTWLPLHRIEVIIVG
jgi:Clp amino terminal domain, pathogenicity island component